ncbi:MAG: penicillin-binding protein 2, partial [Calditrichaeota bacterium]
MAAVRHKSVESFRMQMFPLSMSMIIFVLILRLAWVQVVHRQQFIASAENQHRLTKTLTPERGKIFDRHGKLLAFNLPSVTIVANADSIKDAHKIGARLASITGNRADEMIAKLRAGDGWIELAHKQPMEVKSKLQMLKLDYVGFRDDLQRRYPQGAIGAQVIGFARSDNSGGYGVELKWDSLLRGKPGVAIMQKTGRARLFSSPHHPIRRAVNGADLVLTIDERYQRIAQEELYKAVDEHNARGGSVVIMDPKSGEILAMASAPGFNPNSYADYSDASWKLAAITDQFEPGSTFKLVSLAAMLDTGFKTETDKVFCENGAWHVMGETIEDTKRYANLSVRDVLVYSSNIGMAKLGREFDRQNMYAYAEKFGFGQVSGIELDGEISGVLKSIRDWTAFTPLVFAFG